MLFLTSLLGSCLKHGTVKFTVPLSHIAMATLNPTRDRFKELRMTTLLTTEIQIFIEKTTTTTTWLIHCS